MTSSQRVGNRTLLQRVLVELGIKTLLAAPRDVHILCVSRFTRLFAYGSSTLILALYLSELGVSDSRIGLFMTLTLLGDVLVSLVLTFIADGIGRRKMMLLGAALMVVSGIVFALIGNYWIIVVVSVLGVISPSGNEIGPFKAIEESTIAHLVPSNDRSDILAWYMLCGSAGTALGTLICGWLLQAVQHAFGWTVISSYRLVFLIYSGLGLIKLGLSLLLSPACEAEKKQSEMKADVEMANTAGGTEDDAQLENLLHDSDGEDDDLGVPSATNGQGNNDSGPPKQKPQKKFPASLLPQISTESRRLLLQLCFLFGLDSLASGLVPASFITYFFSTKFALALGSLGTLFFVTNLLSSISSLVASSIARRIGLIKTMVFTHMPSAIALCLIPLPSSMPLAMMFLVIRSSIASMDQAPRQAFLAAAVLPAERTSVMGVVNVVKTLSQSVGPVVTGYLAGINLFWLSFVAAGSMKLAYDGLMLWLFVGYRTREEMRG